ncbi:hypothetical protein D3C73_1368660 [compost metagenome]
MFGCKAVINRDYDRLQFFGQICHIIVCHFRLPKHKTTAVGIQDHRKNFVLCRDTRLIKTKAQLLPVVSCRPYGFTTSLS